MYVDNTMTKKKISLQVYSYDEAFKKSIEYFKGDELAARVWVTKYALKDSFGKIYEASPEDMHQRIAGELARIESKYPNPLTYDEIYALLSDFKYVVPQGSPMTGIGNNFQVASLSNCFVIGSNGPSDSYGGIMRIDQEQVQLMKRRGGVGHDLSHIRPSGSPVLNSALTSTGVVPFMERYSNSTREVAQDGRRGALMLTISVRHPDSEKFIDAKLEAGKITGANVSVKIDDDFMNSVVNGNKYVQKFPIDAEKPKYTSEIDALGLWNKIIHNAWKSAEPGILFWDTVIRESVPDSYSDLGFKTVSTNPCGEIPLCPYDSCRLVAINLYSYVEHPFTPQAWFNFDKFKSHVRAAQRIMDDIIDLELEKIEAILKKVVDDPEEDELKRVERLLWEKIRDKALEGRRTGLGITAEGDMLAALGLRYGTAEATQFSLNLHKFKAIEAYRSSVEMARERGAFPVYNAERELNNPFINRLREADPELYHEMTLHGRRNIALLTIAPTGTTSLMTQTTSGIEPVFMPVYKRRRKVNPNDQNVHVSFVDETGDSWEQYNVFHHHFKTWMLANGYDPGQLETFNQEQIDEIVKFSPYYKATSNDVDWLEKVRMQGAIQKWIDHSISVTINLPNNVDEKLVGQLYIEAWRSGCKGVTVYRDGSRDGVLISGNDNNKKEQESAAFVPKRPKVLEADVVRFKNQSEDWIAFVGLLDNRPYEIFTGLADEDALNIPKTVKKGQIIKNRDSNGVASYDFQYSTRYGNKITVSGLSVKFNPEFWNYAKLLSGVLRHEMPIEHVVALISSLDLYSDTINTWKNGVERALRKFIKDGTQPSKGAKCQSCSSNNLVYQEGCLICKDCGSSKCG